ncbi:glutaminyl-peptide cyclotransferase [Corynebacterium sp. A21]|uniref:glutaminyl-peptide cyclotransferase n=1 Tax=Corynebacterium sp. A21 TaxID=3457318 RepID=UPI003FD40AE8
MVHMALYMPRFLSTLCLVPLLSSCTSAAQGDPPVEHLEPEIIQVHPFDQSSFTQGLEVDAGGNLLVGTGQIGESRIYRSTLDGVELQSADLDPAFFGEGVTVDGDHLWQLTWQDGVALKRDARTLEELDRVELPGEGWGICSRQDELLLSDGSDKLSRLDPETFEVREQIPVTLNGTPVRGLNELECVSDQVYANVFLSTDIMRIDAASGKVTAVIDAANLPNNAASDPNHVLNGIAQLPDEGNFLLAGKRWPDLYEVRFIPAEQD